MGYKSGTLGGGARVVESYGAGRMLDDPFSDSSILAPQQDRSLMDTTMIGSHGGSPPRVVQHESSIRKVDYKSVTTSKGGSPPRDANSSAEQLHSILKNQDQSWRQFSSVEDT